MKRKTRPALNDEQRALVEQHHRLPRFLARYHYPHFTTDFLDEVVAEGAVGLVLAALYFDPARGTPFKAWATRWICGAMMETLRIQGRRVSRLRTISTDYEHAYPVSDSKKDLLPQYLIVDERVPDRVALACDLNRALARMTPKQQRVAHEWLLRDQTKRDVGVDMGYSEGRVSQIASEVKAILRSAVA